MQRTLLAIVVPRPFAKRRVHLPLAVHLVHAEIGIVAITIEDPARRRGKVHVLRVGTVFKTPRQVWDIDRCGWGTVDRGSAAAVAEFSCERVDLGYTSAEALLFSFRAVSILR